MSGIVTMASVERERLVLAGSEIPPLPDEKGRLLRTLFGEISPRRSSQAA